MAGNKAVIAQCKSKKLTIDARRGEGRALRADFTKAVQDAYDQAITARRALIDGSYRLSDARGAAISLPHRLDEVYILCLTGDYYPGGIDPSSSLPEKTGQSPHEEVLLYSGAGYRWPAPSVEGQGVGGGLSHHGSVTIGCSA